jgi:transposase
MRKLDFVNLIGETIESLRERERQEKDARRRLRAQLLRLLKSGETSSIKEACRICGITPKHGYALWGKYQEQGLDEYLKLNWKPGVGKLSVVQQRELMERASRENGFGSQAEVKEYLAQEFAVNYSQGGISLLFQRLKIKAKAPRPLNQKTSVEEQSEYKKTLSPE